MDERHQGAPRRHHLLHPLDRRFRRSGGTRLRLERRERVELPAAHRQGRVELQALPPRPQRAAACRGDDGLHVAGRGESRQHDDGFGNGLRRHGRTACGARRGNAPGGRRPPGTSGRSPRAQHRHHGRGREVAEEGGDGRPGDAGDHRGTDLFHRRRRQGLRLRQDHRRTGRQATETPRHDRPRQPLGRRWQALCLLNRRLARSRPDGRWSEVRQPDAAPGG